ncbi:MAG: hypothetical protein AB7P33_17170 [Dehalococcoidia bacterium]
MAAFSKGLIVFFLLGALVLSGCGGDSEDTSGAASGNGSSGSSGASSNDGGSSNSSLVKEEKLSGEQGSVQSVVRTYFEAILKRDKDKAYDLLDSASKSKCTKAKFGENVDGLLAIFGMFGQDTKLQRVYDVKVSGDTAVSLAEFTIDGKPMSAGPIDVDTNKEGGKWLVVDSCS